MATHEPNWRSVVDDLRTQIEASGFSPPASRVDTLNVLVDWLLRSGRLRVTDMAVQTKREPDLGILDCLKDPEAEDDDE